ncbi:glycosyl transferase family 1 [Sphingobacterium sp. CZ-UAM]|nr:glycosyl transferase family 1 [Sphingobacterium sp. CZ-UAM]
MKILQVGKFYPIRGGVEKVMYDLMLGLSEKGIHCDMLCASTEGYPAGTIEVNPYATIMVVPTAVKIAATMLAPQMIVKLRQIASQYDVIHVHHPDPMAALALFFSGYPGKVIVHWHSDILKQKILLKFYKPMQQWLIQRADMIVGTSPVYVRESDSLKEVQNKVLYVPIGVQPIASDVAHTAKIKARYAGKRLIFSLGRLVEYKGYEYLIRAAQDLDDSYHIVIGGKGPLLESLENLIRSLGLESRVSLLGYMEDGEIAAYYGAADIFCLSSIWKTEAFAIVQIEAMSCGTPIVSTAIPGSGVSWVNQHNISGIVVPVKDETALAKAFKAICEDPSLHDVLRRGSLSRYSVLFTRDKMVEKSLMIYQMVLDMQAHTKSQISIG